MGVENVSQLTPVRKKVQNTCIEKYGSKSFVGSELWRKKTRETNLHRYHAEWYTQTGIFQDQMRDTCIERYGVEHPMQSDLVKEKHDFKRNAAKRHAKMKSINAYATSSSSAENAFFSVLVELYGDVHRHVGINGWDIDFYIPSIDVYVQFDGVYWHGLDRPIEVIKEFRNPRDVTIHGTYARDRLQDEWFARNRLNLLRITDQDFGHCTSQKEFVWLLERHMRVKEEEKQEEMKKNGN